MSSDPWAAAATNTATSAATVEPSKDQPVADREQEFRSLDPNANPFGVESSTGGGGGVRGPQWPDLLDRLIVLKPIIKKVDQPVPNQPNQKQDFYACDLTVLDGGELLVVTPAKPANGNLPALEEQRNTYELPATFTNWYAYGRGITAKLDRLTLPLYLGVVKRCPTGAGYRAGKTWEDSTREFAEWAKNPRGAAPQTSWGLIDPTPEQQALAMEWYRNKK